MTTPKADDPAVRRYTVNEPPARVDLLTRNLAKHGTIYNTLAAGCEINGQVDTTPLTASTAPDHTGRPNATGPLSS